MLIKSGLPCPNCTSSDALAKYENGTYCFSCKYSTLEIIKTLKNQNQENLTLTPNQADWVSLDSHKHISAYTFLKSYHINQQLIDKYQLMWSPQTNRLVLPFIYKTKCVGGQLRSLDKRPMRKYLNVGDTGIWNPNNLLATIVANWAMTTIVVVEDIISAIRINEILPAVALCGTKTDNSTKETLRKLGKTIILWLDSDIPGQNACKKLKCSLQLTNDVKVIKTELDPKCYKKADLESYLIAATVGK